MDHSSLVVVKRAGVRARWNVSDHWVVEAVARGLK